MGNSLRTLDFIPGSGLRGAFAGSYIGRHDVDAEFADFFDGALYVSDAVPADVLDGPSLPMPVTARACKVQCVTPTSLDLAAEHGTDGTGRCLNCGGQLKKRTGWVGAFRSQPYLETVRTELIGNTASESAGVARGTALDGSLRHSTRLSVGGRFVTDIAGPEELLSAFAERIDLVEGRRWRVGSDQTTRGEAQIVSIRSVTEEQTTTAEGDWLALVAASRAVLIDDFLRPIDALDAGLRTQVMSCRFGTVAGWNAAQKLPKQDDVCVVAGSVWAGAVRDPVALRGALSERVGLRRTEGFGQLVALSAGQMTNIAAATSDRPVMVTDGENQ